MSTANQSITIERVMQDPPRDQRWELVKGELHTMSPAGFSHGRLAMKVAAIFLRWAEENESGVVYAAETGFIIERNPDTLRAPDVAFVQASRVPPDGPGFFDGPPDVAVEVVSPGDRQVEVAAKVEAWLAAGTQVVWVVWPQTRSVAVHVADQPVRLFHEGHIIPGEGVLDKLAASVDDIFK